MKNKYLIIGATGAIGYATTKAVLNANGEATLLVRNYEKATELFGYDPNLTIVQGDVENLTLLKALAQRNDFVIHGANCPYEDWNTFLPTATENILSACSNTDATIVFPGNNYGFGNTNIPISEHTPNNPSSSLGKTRVRIEKMLEKTAADTGQKVINVRLPELWGPNVLNKTMAPIFEAALTGKALPWIGDIEKPQQLIYSLDAGRLIYELTQIEHEDSYTSFHASGVEASSVRNWLLRIARASGGKEKISQPPAFLLKSLSLFNSSLRCFLSIADKWNMTVRLDDSKLRSTLPMFQMTDTDQAIGDTLSWFEKRINAQRAHKREKTKRGIWGFMIENAAIGIFPIAIGAIAMRADFVNANAAMFGVVAGIYWTPPFKKLVSTLTSRFRIIPNA